MEENMQPMQETPETPEVPETPVKQEAPAKQEVPVKQEKQKKKWSTGKIVGVIIAAVVLVFVLILCVALVVAGRITKSIEDNPELADQIAEQIGLDNQEDEVFEGTEDTEETDNSNAVDLQEDSAVDMEVLKSYGKFSFTDESLIDEYYDLVVATVGEHELTGGLFQLFYWNQVNSFMSQYGSYISYLGLDTSVSMAEQNYGEDVTWEQYFVQGALNMYLQYCALYDEATANGISLSNEAMASMATLAEDLDASAKENGYADGEEYLHAAFGPGVTMEDYLAFNELYSLAVTYAGQVEASVTVTADEVSAYFDENAEDYEAQGIEKLDLNTVNVRHILVTPEKDVDSDDDGEMDASSDEAWAAAQKRADELYAEWKKKPTEDNFASMAGESTDDPGSAGTGGLYESVYPGQMVTEFNDWCFDAARQSGDSDIVKTSYGYHIMYFVGTNDEVYWYTVAESACKDEQFYDKLAEIFARYKLNVTYENLHIYDHLVVAAAEAAEAQAQTEAQTPEE